MDGGQESSGRPTCFELTVQQTLHHDKAFHKGLVAYYNPFVSLLIFLSTGSPLSSFSWPGDTVQQGIYYCSCVCVHVQQDIYYCSGNSLLPWKWSKAAPQAKGAEGGACLGQLVDVEWTYFCLMFKNKEDYIVIKYHITTSTKLRTYKVCCQS